MPQDLGIMEIFLKRPIKQYFIVRTNVFCVTVHGLKDV